MSEDLEFERRQLEHVIGMVGYEVVGEQQTGDYVIFQVRKRKVKWNKK